MRFSRSFQLKISLFLVLCMFLSYSLPVRAAVFPDVNDIIAEWDPNISTSFRDVYNEYKSLAPADRDIADRVIAANAYRYLLSIGSNILGMTVINEQRFSDFMRAVSPFNMAFNNVVAEYLILAAWSMSGDQYKIFCANVIHNIAINSEYYNSHVIKNDPFIDEAAQGSIQFSYNDIDYNQYVSVYNNIFLGNPLTSTSTAVSFWFNPLPDTYNGNSFTLADLLTYFPLVPGAENSFNVFSLGYISQYRNEFSNYLWATTIDNYSQPYNSDHGDYICFYVHIYSDLSATVAGGDSGAYLSTYLLGISDSTNPSYRYIGNSIPQSNFPAIPFNYSGSDSINTACYDYFYDYIAPYLVYSRGLKVYVYNEYSGSNYLYNLNFPSGYSWVSPQFQPVNIYDNRVYTSSEDTYWYVDQMIDNINNYDYSTNNNGTNNTFYIDNYYITEAASGGGVQLTTSASITYQYITINNITTGPSIGSGPFDVRIINPEDITSEIITNSNSEILNDYNFHLGDLNLGVSVGSGLSNVASNLDPVVSTGSSILADLLVGIPPDIATVVFSLLGLSFIAAIFYRVTSG